MTTRKRTSRSAATIAAGAEPCTRDKELAEMWARINRPEPHVSENMTCARCGAGPCVLVPNVAPDFKNLQGVGLSQCAMLCPEVCAGPWWCGLCNDFHPDALGKHTKHSDWCNTAHPEVRAAWEKKNDHAMMRLVAMVAARGHFLPAFLMNMLFPGFPHADPPGYPRGTARTPDLGPAPQTSDDPPTR